MEAFNKIWLEKIQNFAKNREANEMYYHIGSGSSKAEFPKSVVKYLKKLKINAGKMESTGVSLKKSKIEYFDPFFQFLDSFDVQSL